MPAVRVYKASLAELTATKLRVYAASLSGGAPTTAKLRIYKASLIGAAAVVVDTIAARTVEPEVTVTLNALLKDRSTPDSWTWRVVSGPTTTLTPVNNSVSFVAPSTMPDDDGILTIGVRATQDSVLSAEVTVDITVQPQVRWQYVGGNWVGRKQVQL